MKKLFFIALLFCCYSTFAQSNSDTIQWRPDYKLKMEDFQGTPDNTIDISAVSMCNIDYNISVDSIADTIGVQVECYFERKASWMKKGIITGDYKVLLEHEQGHFNITEVYARRIKKQIDKYKTAPSASNKGIKKIFDTQLAELNKMHKIYDAETKLSTNIAQQKEWTKKINSWLTQ